VPHIDPLRLLAIIVLRCDELWIVLTTTIAVTDANKTWRLSSGELILEVPGDSNVSTILASGDFIIHA
jgi:hypothetical protein